MTTPSTRRSFLTRSARYTAAVVAAPYFVRAAEPKATGLETKVISQQPEFYHGWPTVARRKNGELWVTWSGGRESHVDPFGQVHAMTSRDDGATWSFPRVLLDSAIDDRDSGVVETAQGSLLVTTFTSLAYAAHLQKQSVFGELKESGWEQKRMPLEQRAKWEAVHARLNDAERKAELGEWLIRSTDGGRTWSTASRTATSSC